MSAERVSNDRYTDYDRFAWFYNRHWGAEYHRQTLPILDRLGISGLSPGAAVLDLCCGTGRVSAVLVDRGFRVTGVEGSGEMLRYARENAPGAEFVLDDARSFQISQSFDLAFSVFESLNHVMSIDDLGTVFRNVHSSLLPRGRFIFDLNREPVFEKFWNLHYIIAEEDHVFTSRTRYQTEQKFAESEITMFRLNGTWQRSDVTISQRCHGIDAVEAALHEAGFRQIELFDAASQLGMTGDISFARTFFRACRA
ncbi:MAG: class I SAM-dependent methyltransferase [Acidobacteriota bacterium]|nr:class I SAM-dependent methyltransferase [Acidobacteriota bacterium]